MPFPWRSRRPSKEYARVFSAFFAGVFLIVSGVIGFEARGLHGFFRGGRWVDGPVWWQIAVGAGLLLLAAYLARGLGGPIAASARAQRERIVKHVGRGRTTSARRHDQRRIPGGAPKS